MLTLEQSKVSRLLASGDTRWIHRAAYDLMDYGRRRPSRRPRRRGRGQYGSLPQQLRDPNSFAARLRDTPGGPYPPRHCHQRAGGGAGGDKAMLVMVHRLHTRQIQVTVLNFQPAHRRQRQVAPSGTWRCSDRHGRDQVIAEVDHGQTFAVWWNLIRVCRW